MTLTHTALARRANNRRRPSIFVRRRNGSRVFRSSSLATVALKPDAYYALRAEQKQMRRDDEDGKRILAIALILRSKGLVRDDLPEPRYFKQKKRADQQHNHSPDTASKRRRVAVHSGDSLRHISSIPEHDQRSPSHTTRATTTKPQSTTAPIIDLLVAGIKEHTSFWGKYLSFATSSFTPFACFQSTV
eukprot:TRINITY_DN6519_c0_g1_i2.p1 TRINITY_DN6519_c0_g1~~TRINITY_DN6519_c0_g1_i2.p1  ORF type:complete len:196 (+),score=12.95 TRINITY_DN6519_c0_g1_i2:24-590(+)